MDIFTWIALNGWLPPVFGMIATFIIGYVMAKRSRKSAKKEMMEVIPEVIGAIREEIIPFIPTLDEISEEIGKKAPEIMMKSLGGQGSQIAQEITKTDDFQDLLGQIGQNPDVMSAITDKTPGTDRKSILLMKYGERLMDIVVKGVGNKITKMF